jgi:hypothetical protein
MASALAEGLADFILTFLEAAPVLVKALGVLIGHILDTIIELIPKIVTTLKELILGVIEVLRETIPEFITLAFEILTAFLSGFADNIGEITNSVVDILTGFIDAFAERVPDIVDSIYNLVKAILTGVIRKLPDLVRDLFPFGEDLMGGLFDGIVSGAEAVWEWFGKIAGKILDFFKSAGSWLKDAGWDTIWGFHQGIIERAVALGNYIESIKGRILDWMGDSAEYLYTFGKNVLVGLHNGIVDKINDLLIPYLNKFSSKVRGWIGDAASMLYSTGRNIIVGLYNGIIDKIKELSGKVKDAVVDFIPGPVKKIFGIASPSKLFHQYGEWLVEGLVNGMSDPHNTASRASEALANDVVKAYQLDNAKIKDHTQSAFQKAIEEAADSLQMSNLTNPVITPVLDLSRVNRDAKSLHGLFGSDALQANTSYLLGNAIASTELDQSETTTESGVREVTFVQNNHSPETLSEAEIYRRTRSQLALAKEELGV